MTITAVIRRMNQGNVGLRWFDPHAGNAQVVPHGFRSTFRDWAAEKTELPNEMVEMALAHAIGDGTVAAYQRSDLFDKRRNLMADWAKFINTMPAVGNVIPMHKAA